MVGHMQSVSAPKYRLVAVAEDSRVRVFAEPYLVDTITALFNLTAKHRYVILVDEAGSYKVVDMHQLHWVRRPNWAAAMAGEVAAEGVENSQGFDTLDQAVVYLSSELNGAEVMYFTTKQSAYIVTRLRKHYSSSRTWVGTLLSTIFIEEKESVK